MKIYTKTGDAGETGLFGGGRVPKDALRIEAYGTVDELNAHLGLARALQAETEVEVELSRLQSELFVLGADLAAPLMTGGPNVRRIGPDHIQRLENVIDAFDARLEPLKSFILPGGSRTAAELHVARTVCRRAERLAVRLAREENIGPLPVVYLNRLADLLFVLARLANALDGGQETLWHG